MKKPPPSGKHPHLSKPWPKEVLLKEARRRAKLISDENVARGQRQTQVMLARLLHEAGWSNQEFLDTFIQDVTTRQSKRH